jgi:hypothetical protein
MIEKIPFMLTLSKHEVSFFSNLLAPATTFSPRAYSRFPTIVTRIARAASGSSEENANC